MPLWKLTTMKKTVYLYLFFVLAVAKQALAQKPFTAGNIVVYRVGNGSTTLNSSAAPVYLDEYTVDGALVQSIPMPTAVSGNNNILTTRGSQLSEGMLNLSADGKYLVLAGMNTAPGGGSSGTATVIGTVDFNGKVNTSTVVNDFAENTTNRTRVAVSTDGKRVWFAGSTAIRYTTVGSSSSVLLSNTANQVFDLAISNDQLYSGTDANAVIYSIGNGLPAMPGQVRTVLPGLPADIQAGGQFAFADLDPGIPGPDVLFVASPLDIAGPMGGIRKFSLVGGSWRDNGSIGGNIPNAWYTGLTVKVAGSAVSIFASRAGSNSVRGGELVKIVDNSGYNATITGSPVVIASVATPNTMAFRGLAVVPQPAPFSPGNIVVYRVGDGNVTLGSTAAPVYLDEYTSDGILVQSILMPTSASAGNNILTTRGNQLSEGMLNLSADGRYLVVPGMNTAPGTGSSGTATVIGLVDYNAKVNTSTAITDFVENTSNRTKTAISDDGSQVWFGGAGVLRYATTGSNTSKLINNSSSVMLNLSIADKQLYAGTGDVPYIYSAGNGLPSSSGQSLFPLPALPVDLQPGGQFAFADLEPTVPGVDVLYVASPSDAVSPAVGIRKFSLVDGAWKSNGSIGGDIANSWYAGLTIKVSAGIVTIFSSRGGANSIRGGELVKIVDNSGYNATITGAPVVIASVSPVNTMAFRGVAKVPVGCPPVNSLRVPAISSTEANIAWNSTNGGSSFEYAFTKTPSPPLTGTITTNSSATLTGLDNATPYYVHVRTACGTISKSEWSSVVFTTGCQPPALPMVSVSVNSNGNVLAKWNKVFGAASYEYQVSVNALPPTTGSITMDTTITMAGLNPVTRYYLHVRSNCGSGAFSAWTTREFKTDCFLPGATINFLSDKAGIVWNKVPNAVKYEYALTSTAAKPMGGQVTTDTFYLSGTLSAGTMHYFQLRTICSTGAVSNWLTIPIGVQGLQVYPNPVNDMLNIRLNGLAGSVSEIMIVDAMGRVMSRVRLNNSAAAINTRSWAPGIYLVHYNDGEAKYSVRVIKQ